MTMIFGLFLKNFFIVNILISGFSSSLTIDSSTTESSQNYTENLNLYSTIEITAINSYNETIISTIEPATAEITTDQNCTNLLNATTEILTESSIASTEILTESSTAIITTTSPTTTTTTTSTTTTENRPKCFVTWDPLEIGLNYIEIEITTNLIRPVFCINDGKYLILSTQRSNNTTTKENNSSVYNITCDSLLPMDRYSVITTLSCDFQKSTLETKSESINCKEKKEVDYEWSCEALQCIDCLYNFELKNLETGLLLFHKNTPKFIISEMFPNVVCGIYEISSFISKIDFNDTSPVGLVTFEVIPTPESDESIDTLTSLTKLINPTDGNIVLSIKFNKNIWSSCANTHLNIVVVKEICSMTKNITIDYLGSIPLQKNPLNKPIEIDLDNEYSYGAKFTVEYKIEKVYGDKKYQRSLTSYFDTIEEEFIDSVKVYDVIPSRNYLEFKYKAPYQCYDRYSTFCFKNSDFTSFSLAQLDKETMNGVCGKLVSGTSYSIRSITYLGNLKNSVVNFNIFTELTRASNFSLHFKTFEQKTGLIEFSVSGECKYLNLCSNDYCNELTVCNHKNCEKFGRIICHVKFSKYQLNYGQYQNFFIKTVGTNGDYVNSELETVKIDLDKVYENEKLKVIVIGKLIKIELANENLPVGLSSDDYLRIKCLDLEYLDEPENDFFHTCNGSICNCQNTLYGSSYSIILQTVKNNSMEWEPQEVRLQNQYNTEVLPPTNIFFNNSTLSSYSVTINWSPPPRRFTGFTFEINGVKAQCIYSGNKYMLGILPDCEQNSDKISYKFSGLLPGNEYVMYIRTFKNKRTVIEPYASDITSFEVSKNVMTDLDGPTNTSFDEEKFSFNAPRVENCELKFYLAKIESKKNIRLKEYSVECKPEKYNEIALDYELSIGDEYLIEYTVSKEFVFFGKKIMSGKFESTVYIQLSGGWIALITVGCIAVLLIPALAVFIFKRREKIIKNTEHSIRPGDLGELLETWDQNQNSGCSIEWEELTRVTKQNVQKLDLTTEEAREDENMPKNRYRDILPYDISRVKLLTNVGEHSYSGDDYINANFIPGLYSQKKFIACQGPLKNTIGDFWSMILEQKVSIIVMLTRCKENNKGKCEVYWPEKQNEPATYGDLKITLKSTNQMRDFIVRIFKLETETTKRIMIVRHYQYLSWPDRNFPRVEILYDFMRTIKSKTTRLDNRGPVVVHCSAGVGRTGTFIAIENVIELLQIKNKKYIDIFDTVVEMRKYRVSMVQNESQYRFIYDMLHYYYQTFFLKRSIDDVLDEDTLEMKIIS